MGTDAWRTLPSPNEGLKGRKAETDPRPGLDGFSFDRVVVVQQNHFRGDRKFGRYPKLFRLVSSVYGGWLGSCIAIPAGSDLGWVRRFQAQMIGQKLEEKKSMTIAVLFRSKSEVSGTACPRFWGLESSSPRAWQPSLEWSPGAIFMEVTSSGSRVRLGGGGGLRKPWWRYRPTGKGEWELEQAAGWHTTRRKLEHAPLSQAAGNPVTPL